MTFSADAEPLARPATSEGAKAFIVTPFARLARTHAASTMADATVAASLAGSLFFSLPAGDARAPVLRYLVITMLPFAALSPLIGPLIDRMKGGHRLMLIASAVLRSILCYLMATVISGESLLFFFYALCLLVCQKAYQVARSALVPTVVRSDAELVEANSKLSLISGLAGFVGVLPAAILLNVFGPQWSLGLGMIIYAVAAVLGLGIKGSRVATESANEIERHELRGAGIVMAGSAMGLIRACVGFLTLLIAFDFRSGDRPAWQFGFVGAVSVGSQLAGAATAPRIRTHTTEENLLTGVLGLLVIGGFFSLLLDDVAGAAVLGASVGFAAGGGKLAFDSILQRDAPDANRGRAFARFETRFQVTWVIGALIPVAITLSAGTGFLVVFALALMALSSYVIARLAYAHRTGTHQSTATAAAVEIEERFAGVSGEVKVRLAQAPRAAIRRLRTGRVRDLEDGGYYEADAHFENDPEFHPAHDQAPHGRAAATGPVDDEYDEDAEPEWADQPTQRGSDRAAEHGNRPERVRRRGRRRRSVDHAPAPEAAPFDELAPHSPTAWSPPEDSVEFPWQPPPEPPPADSRHRHDADPDDDPEVDNPYPWTPDGGPNR